ncbi:MAG TPA: HAMP domain-containing sensor histidine kinase [Terriglobales bacterium]|nr:HAMP domain-containing sensor histidine kinase [Terriglobales bacterium]
MVTIRLRTKFLLSMVLISAGLTSLSLLLVRRSMESEVREQIFSDLRNSVTTFKSFEEEQETTLSHSADLVADLPDLRALMTTNHEATIQDGSTSKWRLAGSDLFALANRSGKIVALHTYYSEFTWPMAQKALDSSLERQERWWFGAKHLYEIFLKPIYFGPASADHLLGFLVIGREIDQNVATQIGRVASSGVAFYYGEDIITSTLTLENQTELMNAHLPITESRPVQVKLGSERFLATTLDLPPRGNPSVRLAVLKSYDAATAFLERINRLLLALGVLALLVGGALVFLISHTFTQPLSNLLAGVAALEHGDFTYELDARGGDEVAELTRAFDRMRESLAKTQQNLLESERLATIGRMASSISHDLRHSLAAIVANAEFLCEQQLTMIQREELYQEVRAAVVRMTELIDSLLEFSRTRASMRPIYGDLRDTVVNAIETVKSNPQFREIQIVARQTGNVEGWFDHRKLERAFSNLVLNACESVDPRMGCVTVLLREIPGGVRVEVKDNGHGIPESVRTTLFDPFVSQGKENGTGLGLTVVQKIVQDHGGEVMVESTSSEGTTFRVVLPRPAPVPMGGEPSTGEESVPATHAGVNSTKPM